MIEHIVLFRWKSDATDAQVAAVLEALRSLKDQIAGTVDLAVGADFSGRAQGYTHALVARFSDRTALAAYGPNPAHQTVIKSYINPIVESVIAFDFEIMP